MEGSHCLGINGCCCFLSLHSFLKTKLESVAYEFGSNKGMIQYMYAPGK